MKLTREEILLIVGVLTALVLGASVKHYRDSHRLAPLSAAPASSPRPHAAARETLAPPTPADAE